MVVVILTTVFVGVLIYRRIKKRRARKRAIKLAAVKRGVSSPVAVDVTEETFLEDEVIIIGRESTTSHPSSGPPPYSTPSPHPYGPSEGPRPLTVHELGIQVGDKPPPYSATALQVQNS